MLTPASLNSYPNEIVALYEELEAFILGDISRRIAKAGELTGTAEIQARVLRELGADLTDIKSYIAQTNKLALDKVDKIFTKAVNDSFTQEMKTAELNGKSIKMTAAKYQILENSINEVGGALSFTGSLGMAGLPLEAAYRQAVNTAYLQVSTGASDYISAVKRQVRSLAAEGLRIIDYESGRRDHVDVAVRRAVVTGLAAATQKISLLNARELGADLVEVSAHVGARPSHAEWQGRIFSLSGKNKKYPNFYGVTGYGTGEGLGGYNCRHSFHAYFEGMTPTYTEEELANIDPPDFEFSVDGKTYTAWTASQKQRQIERGIRKTKREIAGYTQSGLAAEATAAKALLRQQVGLYEQFSGEAGLLTQPERLGVSKDASKRLFTKPTKSLIIKTVENTSTPITTDKPDYVEKFILEINKRKDMPKDFKIMLTDRFMQGSELAQRVYVSRVKGVTIENGYTGDDRAWYSHGSKRITMDYAQDMKNPLGNGMTYFHEHGHLIDYQGRPNPFSAQGKAAKFSKALRADFENYVTAKMSKLSINRQEAYKVISRELMFDNASSVSDLFGGLSNNACTGGYGHRDGYWLSHKKGVELEAFAEFFAAEFNEANRAYIEVYFPTAREEFIKLLGGL